MKTLTQGLTALFFHSVFTSGEKSSSYVIDEGFANSALSYSGNISVVNANNNNTILKSEGNLTACTPQTVTFKYTRNFSCPAAGAIVTGGWSAAQRANLIYVLRVGDKRVTGNFCILRGNNLPYFKV